jgi:hypothetical protein
MLLFAASGSQGTRQSTVGQPLVVPAGHGPLEITRPDGRTAINSNDTELSGMYSIRQAGSDEVDRFAVNVDTRESDLVRLNMNELPPRLTLHNLPQAAVADGGDPGLALSAAWQQPLLWTAIGLLFVEMCLAWLFGRGAL